MIFMVFLRSCFVDPLCPFFFPAAIGVQMTLKAMESRFWAITAQVGQLFTCSCQYQVKFMLTDFQHHQNTAMLQYICLFDVFDYLIFPTAMLRHKHLRLLGCDFQHPALLGAFQLLSKHFLMALSCTEQRLLKVT